MFKRSLGALFVIVMLVTTALAEERPAAKDTGLMGWLKQMQKKLDLVSPRKTLSVSTGVAGVRGAKDDSARSKLYWKGKKGEEPVSEQELKEFKEGVSFAESGDAATAVHEFEEFMKQYPDSALIPDARKTLDLLKTEMAAAPQPEAKVEQKTEEAEEQQDAAPQPEADGETKAGSNAEAK